MTKTPEQIARAWAVMDRIEKEPWLHDQFGWAMGRLACSLEGFSVQDMTADCGTTACFAGWTSLLEGDVLVGSLIPALRYQHVADRAMDLLGLTGKEDIRLFRVSQGITDLRAAVLDIFGPRPTGSL